MSNKTNVEHLAGWVVPETLQDAILRVEYSNRLLKDALKGKKEGYQMVMFRIPFKKNGMINKQAIVEIENLLQEKYPL